MTKTEIDKLGERLRSGSITDEDRRSLDEYRISFDGPLSAVMSILRDRCHLESTGRGKTTEAIRDKLRREERMKLSRMQDVAGCRVVRPNVHAQDVTVAVLEAFFDEARVSDRRSRPSHGYRAVHVIVSMDGRLVEIQVRTLLQDKWAQLSEKLSKHLDPGIKYGGGPEGIIELMTKSSVMIADIEATETKMNRLRALMEDPSTPIAEMPQEVKREIRSAQERIEMVKAELLSTLEQTVEWANRARLMPKDNDLFH